jgi:hypothetical protein
VIFEDLYKTRLTTELNNSDTVVLYTGTRRREAINDGVREFAALTKCYVQRSTIAVSCNTAEYVLSTIDGFAQISAEGYPEYRHTDSNGVITIVTEPDFKRRDELWSNRYSLGWRQSTTPVTMPTAYYIRKDGGRLILGLRERPDVGSSETADLVVPNVARPPAMTSTGEIPFTDASSNTRHDLTDYHPAFAHYAAYKLLPLIGDTQTANEQLQKFLGYVARYKDDQRPKGGTHVTMARSYYSESMRRGGSEDSALDRSERWRWQ